MKRYLLAILLLFVAAPLYAQTSDTIKQNTAFTVAADHDGIDTDEYRLYQNGVRVQTKAVSNLLVGTIAFDRYVAGLPKGTYVFYVEAVGPGGAGVSTTLTLTVTPGNPKPPTNLRLIR
jgi:hypothetical protein